MKLLAAYGNLRITTRILGLVIAAVLMVLSMIMIVYASNTYVARAAERLDMQRSMAELSASLEREATTIRALLLRYVVSRDPEFAATIHTSLDAVQKGLKRLHGRSNVSTDTQAILAMVGDAQAKFDQVNELGTIIGDGTDKVVFGGLMTSMHHAILALETELRVWPNQDFALRLIESMRRAELEYLLESDIEAEGQHRKAFRELEFLLADGTLDPTTGERLLTVAGDYRRSFVAVTEKMTPFRQETGVLVNLIDQLRAELLVLEAYSNAAMQAAAAEQAEVRLRGQLQLWILSAIFASLFIALAAVTAKSIIRPIREIETALSGISSTQNDGDGKSSVILPVSIPCTEQQDEIGAIARAFQTTFRQLERTRDDLVEAEKQAALAGLVAGIAHEINTPVGVAVTAASIMADEMAALEHAYRREEMTEEIFTAFLDRSRHAVRIVSENLARGAELVRSFKQVAVDSHQTEAEPIAVLPYLRNALISLAHEMKTGRILLSVDGDETATVRIAPTQLWQIVSNLVLNARIHAFEGATDRWITVEVKKRGGRVVVRVADNGRGMPENVRRRCFEPFFTTRRGTGGSGLGLSVVHSIVTGAGGRISTTSREGNGTTFYVQFPAVT